MPPKKTISKKERALIEKIERFFSMKRDINTKRFTKGEFGSDDSIWELQIHLLKLSKIPFFIVSSIGSNDSLLRVYVKVKLNRLSIPMRAPMQYVLASEAAKHSLFFTPVPKSPGESHIIGGFAIEALLQKEYITEKELIDTCLRIAFGYNSIINALELSGIPEQIRQEQNKVNGNGNDYSYHI